MTSNQRPTARSLILLFILPAFAALPPLAFAGFSAATNERVILRDGWMLQSSCVDKANGQEISAPGFPAAGWHQATLPATVLAALVEDKTYPDPYFGDNLRSVPGTTYPVGKDFSTLPMPAHSPFRCSWWYRTGFALPRNYEGRHVWLHFAGINYRANIWLNGHRIADARNFAGAYRSYEFDVSTLLMRDELNILAVETFAQTEKDLGITWVDWNPAPPDKNMGLWREVYLQASGLVAIRYPQVITHFPDASLDRADLTVEAELRNASSTRVTGILSGRIEDITFERDITLKPEETRTIRFSPGDFPQLRIENPRLWWPRQMGAPTLHELSLRFLTGQEVSDSDSIPFGIREITSELDKSGHLMFRVNGKRLLIRGAGWAPDMLLRESSERLNTEFRYVRDLNLNAIRLEGKLESEEFYDRADQEGVLIMAGWSCCDDWEQWSKWKPGNFEIASASLRSEIMRIRHHPSVLAWLNGSDNPPPANVEKAYIGVLKQSDWPNPYLSSASQHATPVTGPSGVKMLGPYDYVPPDYWLQDAGRFGGAYGFSTESSPGPAVPPLGSLKKMLPATALAPDNPVWNYHAGSEGFQNLTHFEEAMNAIYGPSASLYDYELKSQAMAYDSERAMFEAYSRNKYGSTGLIQWMLNNAWPSLIWHLYDYYLQPAGGYFGVKKACEPLHIQYSYDDRSIVVVNSSYKPVSRLIATVEIYDIDLHERFSRELPVDVDADGVARIMTVPAEAFDPSSPIYFVRLRLSEDDGTIVSTNFYWLSTKKNVYDWNKTTYQYTPVSSYEDFSALGSLPKMDSINVSAKVEKGSDGALVRVKLQNPTDHLLFQLQLGIVRTGEDAEILPVLWQDNYIELMPGESREITAQFLSPDILLSDPQLTITGWNMGKRTVALRQAGADKTLPSSKR